MFSYEELLNICHAVKKNPQIPSVGGQDVISTLEVLSSVCLESHKRQDQDPELLELKDILMPLIRDHLLYDDLYLVWNNHIDKPGINILFSREHPDATPMPAPMVFFSLEHAQDYIAAVGDIDNEMYFTMVIAETVSPNIRKSIFRDFYDAGFDYLALEAIRMKDDNFTARYCLNLHDFLSLTPEQELIPDNRRTCLLAQMACECSWKIRTGFSVPEDLKNQLATQFFNHLDEKGCMFVICNKKNNRLLMAPINGVSGSEPDAIQNGPMCILGFFTEKEAQSYMKKYSLQDNFEIILLKGHDFLSMSRGRILCLGPETMRITYSLGK